MSNGDKKSGSKVVDVNDGASVPTKFKKRGATPPPKPKPKPKPDEK